MATRLYLAGPMTGIADLNFPAFHAAAAELRAIGFDIENPVEINPDPGMAWRDCMRVDIKHLVDCDGVAMLPGWENSRGATLERTIAIGLGLRVHMVADLLAAELTRQAADLDMAPSTLSRKLNPAEGDTQRFNVDDLEAWIGSTSDAAAVIEYLAAKFMDNDDARRARLMAGSDPLALTTAHNRMQDLIDEYRDFRRGPGGAA